MRSFVRLLLAVFVVGIALQCQDRQGPTEVDSSGLQTATAESDITDLLGDIFDGALEAASNTQARNMFRQFGRGEVADAQAKAIDLVDFILDKQANDQTVGDDEDVLAVILMILAYVGFDTSALEDYEGDPDDLAIGMCNPDAECTVVTGNMHAGVMAPAGAFDEDVVIIIQRLPDFPPIEGPSSLAPAVTNFYPLDSGFDQYPLFYDITTIPDGVELNAGFFADVGLCVLEQSDGWEQGAPDDVLADLVLAHPAPDGPGTGNCDDNIECLPIVNVAGLIDCADLEEGPELSGFPGLLDDFTKTLVSPFSPSLLYASPGELGGQASSFSPFAAIDPLNETTTTLEAESALVNQPNPVNLTAMVVPTPFVEEEGQVNFYEGESFLGSDFLNVDGVATLSLGTSIGCEIGCLGVGSHTIHAEFLGTPSHAASTSLPVVVVVEAE